MVNDWLTRWLKFGNCAVLPALGCRNDGKARYFLPGCDHGRRPGIQRAPKLRKAGTRPAFSRRCLQKQIIADIAEFWWS
jgi:hypothetical protein